MKSLAIATIAAVMHSLSGTGTFASEMRFSVDPASIAISGNLTHDDVLLSRSAVVTKGSTFGLADDFRGGVDSLNEHSYGQNNARVRGKEADYRLGDPEAADSLDVSGE